MDILIGVLLGYGIRYAQDKGLLKGLGAKLKALWPAKAAAPVSTAPISTTPAPAPVVAAPVSTPTTPATK